MAAAKTGVRIYQRIRRYIDKIYLYGFLSRRDFARLNHGSAKDYDVSVKLIKELFSDDGFNQKRGVQSVSRDYHTSGDLHLPDSYLLCQLDLQDMAEYLHYLNIARQGPAVAPHFHDLLQLQPIPGHCVGTAYNRLDHLCSYGCM
jgi:hypothetical protein